MASDMDSLVQDCNISIANALEILELALSTQCTRTYGWEATAAPAVTTSHDENS